MNNKLFNLAKMICFLTMILASISCGTRSKEETEHYGNLVLDIKTDTLTYQIYENHSKINSGNIEQCEKFLEYKNFPESMEIYGADIADLYAIFFNKKRDDIKLNNKTAIFYTVIYNGAQNDSVKKDIIDYLLSKRNLQILESSTEIKAYEIQTGNADKLAKHVSNKNIEEKSDMRLTADNYELTNCNLTILATALNELYPNTFFYEGKDKTRYDLEIPLQKNINSIKIYLSKNYGINSVPITKSVNIYEIKDRN